jgi:hypothetical protein
VTISPPLSTTPNSNSLNNSNNPSEDYKQKPANPTVISEIVTPISFLLIEFNPKNKLSEINTLKYIPNLNPNKIVPKKHSRYIPTVHLSSTNISRLRPMNICIT